MRCSRCRVILLVILALEICSTLRGVSFVNWWWLNKEEDNDSSSSPSRQTTVLRDVSLVTARSTGRSNNIDTGISIRRSSPSTSSTTNSSLPVKPLPLCTRQQVIDGRWEPAKYDEPPYMSKNIHLQCHNNTYYEERGYETFDWTPNNNQDCEFLRWNATSFCQLVKRATVSIIGDSLSWEMYSSLMQLLGVRVHQLDQHRSRDENRNHVQGGCRKPKTRIVFRNDPRLEFLRDSINNDFPVILILNRGPHYVSDSALIQGMHETIEVLYEWRAACARLGFKCHLFWRTSVPGHPHCNRTDTQQQRAYYQRPDNRLERVEELIANPTNYDTTSITYHWYDFQPQNQIILQMLQDSGLNATVLDAYYLNVRRVDGHRPNDCLHNCYPGKMDVSNQLFLHFLTLERTNDDVEHLQRLFWKSYEEFHGAEAREAKQKKEASIALQ